VDIIAKTNTLLLAVILTFTPIADAGWLDDIKNASQKMADKVFKPEEKPIPRITDADLVEYPVHYKFHRVEEPVHKSPLFFVETGDVNKPVVILVHGLGEAASKDWLKVIPALEKHYHVYALDLPGFGLSKGVYFKYSPKQYSAVLNWFVEQYAFIKRDRADKPTIVGHSMGGAVSLYFAATYPQQLKKLVLADAAGILERTSFVKHMSELGIDGTQYSPTWRRLTAKARNFSEAVVEYSGSLYDPTTLIKDNETVRSLVLSQNGNANAALALMETDFSKLDFSTVAPTHLIWGENDPVAPPRTGKVLQHILPSVELHTIKGAGHVPMNSHPDQFNDLLLRAIENPPVKSQTATVEVVARTAHCVHDDQSYFTGYYERLTIDNCKLAVLDNVTVKSLSVNESIVNISNSQVGRDSTLITVIDSAITATASTFLGTLKSEESRLDLAGVTLTSTKSVFEATKPSLIIFSLSTINSPLYQGTAQGFFELESGTLEKRLQSKILQETP
jgi:pimeloyl-ACP methyl ester carboxylesterase